MARSCTVCTHRSAVNVNAALLQGRTIVDVSREFRLSGSALSRHRARHLSASILREVRVSDAVAAGDLAVLLVAVLEDTNAVRIAALQTGNGDLVLRAANQTRAIVETLADRLGLDDVETVRELAMGERIMGALTKAIRQRPDLAALMATELRHAGHTADAEEFDEAAAVAQQIALTRGTP